ncbi:hypothetical protein LIER_34168 [Lithospermum erythrorhizon]|uniref:Uncharacterized protein n=1 Tax=Lithospermum erythrorhizon TaxID=34254 RepID=A0AAV3S162_LITER
MLTKQLTLRIDVSLQSQGQVEAENNFMTGEKRNLMLQFRNKLPQEIVTGIYNKAKELTSIEVELVDGSGQVVNSGPEASAAGEK